MVLLFIGMLIFLLIIITIVAVYLYRRPPLLPPHLRPYFKSNDELEAFTKKTREAAAKRQAELTDPANAEEAAEYITLYGYNIENTIYENALHMVEANLKDNPNMYGQLLGEMYAFQEYIRIQRRLITIIL